MSASILSRLDPKQNNSSLQHSSKSLKFRSYRVLRPAEQSNIIVFDDRQIAEQINQEMNKIDEIIATYKVELEMERATKQDDRTDHEQVIQLDEIIRQKDAEIKSINDEIKSLKEAKSKRQLKESKRQLALPKTFTLAQQLRSQGIQLNDLIGTHSKKMMNHKMLHLAIRQAEKAHAQKFPERQISYDSFKERNEEFKKEEEFRTKKKELKIPSFKQRMETIVEPSTINHRGETEAKSMRQLQDKKKKMKLAIRNAKKKHMVEIIELTAKLEFLRDEDALMNEQIRQKRQEKRSLEEGFERNMKRLRNRKLKGISVRNRDNQEQLY